MSKWLNLAWLMKALPFGFNIYWRYLMYWPGWQNRRHAQMTEIEYRLWHAEWVTEAGVACYQCGGIAKINVVLDAKAGAVACARCKSLLWRQGVINRP